MTATDYHMHLERGPWTLDWLLRFVETARARGLSEIGFSEHPHRFREWRAMYPQNVPPWVGERCTERLDSYVRLVEEARRAGLPVKIGMEWDFIPGNEAQVERAIRAYPWDYAIGSVHWLPPEEPGGPWWDFDNLSRAAEWDGRDVLDAYRRYFRILVEAARTGLFDFIGHADVVKACGYRPSEDISDLYDETAAAFAAAGLCAEINTAGWRKPVGEAYPAPRFLQACRRAGVPVLINSDAHAPEDVGQDFDRAILFAREAGYSEVATFSARIRAMVPIS